MSSTVHPGLKVGVAVAGVSAVVAALMSVPPAEIAPLSVVMPDQSVSRDMRYLSFGLPGFDTFFAAFADVSGGVTGAGGSFLDLLADETTAGVGVLGTGVASGANLLASSLVGGAGLLTSGAAGGAESFAQVIQGFSDAIAELGTLPESGDFVAAFNAAFGGLAGAGMTFLDMVNDQIAGGTALLTNGLAGGVHLLASSLVAGVGLLTAGATGGADAFVQVIQGLSNAIGQFDGTVFGSGAFMSAFGDIADGLTGAGGAFLDVLADGITGGTALLTSGLAGGAGLLADSLVAGVGLLASGVAGGVASFAHVIQGFSDAVGEFGPEANSASVAAVIDHVIGGLASAGSTFLDTVEGQIAGGTALLNSSLTGAANLVAGSIVSGTNLVTSGVAGGAASFNHALGGVADAIDEFGPNAFTDAGSSFVHVVGDQVTGGTAVLNTGLTGGAQLAAGSIVGGTGLITAGTSAGANSLNQVVSGLSDAIGEFNPNSTAQAARAAATQPAPNALPSPKPRLVSVPSADAGVSASVSVTAEASASGNNKKSTDTGKSRASSAKKAGSAGNR